MGHLRFLSTAVVRLILCHLSMTMSQDSTCFLKAVFRRRFMFLGHPTIRAIALTYRNLLLLSFRSPLRPFPVVELISFFNLVLCRRHRHFGGLHESKEFRPLP
jgi:hypothetical protein